MTHNHSALEQSHADHDNLSYFWIIFGSKIIGAGSYQLWTTDHQDETQGWTKEHWLVNILLVGSWWWWQGWALYNNEGFLPPSPQVCHYKLLVRFFVSLITKTNIWQTDRKIFNEINQVSGNVLPGTIDKVDKLWF